MANINTETIAGFSDMTAEQKVEALLGMEIPDEVDLSGYVEKSVFDRKATEAANLSKALREKEKALNSKATEQMTETEKLQAQMEAKIQEMQEASEEAIRAVKEENEALKRKDTLRDYQTNFGLLGFDEKLSGETATALADGDSAKVFANLKKFLESYKNSIEAEHLRKMTQPDGAGGDPNKKQAASVEIAKRLFGAKSGTNQNYESVMGNYLKK